jgi:hypothetical protein
MFLLTKNEFVVEKPNALERATQIFRRDRKHEKEKKIYGWNKTERREDGDYVSPYQHQEFLMQQSLRGMGMHEFYRADGKMAKKRRFKVMRARNRGNSGNRGQDYMDLANCSGNGAKERGGGGMGGYGPDQDGQVQRLECS